MRMPPASSLCLERMIRREYHAIVRFFVRLREYGSGGFVFSIEKEP
jgi:hypothetical protein